MKKIEKEVKKEVKREVRAVKHSPGMREFKKDPALRVALMSAYFPENYNGVPKFPKPVGNYDETGYQGMDKTIHNIGHSASAIYVVGQASTITNVALFQGFGTTEPLSMSAPYPYDRQFPQISQAHKCRLLGLTVKFEMTTGNLANTTGNVVIALVPAPETWGAVTGPIWSGENLALMHGSVTVTAAELAASPVVVAFARVGSLSDSFKSTIPMDLAYTREMSDKISAGRGFTHNPSRIETPRTRDQPTVVGGNFYPTVDVLVPTWVSNFSAGTNIRVTVVRYWDLELVPQDTSVMTGINSTGTLPDSVAKKTAEIVHALPIIPAPTATMPAEAIVEKIATVVERGGRWIDENQDNIKTAAKVFGTTVSIGTKLAGMLL